ncbi:MAG TPA: DNA polymerase III subunit beta [Rhabdochlamydiaceae bacterium]|jgi:DNA polymerase-3 subunit beta
MKCIVSRLYLLALISKIQNVTASKPAIPILANVLLEAIDDELILSATDLTVSMRAYVEAKVQEEGAITFPARRFFQLIRELSSPHIEIHTLSPEVGMVNAGTSHFKIQGMHKNEFPNLPNLSEGFHFALPAPKFKELLSCVAFAAAHDDDRQVLNGVCIEIQENAMVFISTDGKRLAKIKAQTILSPPEHVSYIIPIKAIDEMIRALAGEEGDVKITLLSDKIAIEIGAATLISKLIAGKYPDVSGFIPEKKANPLLVHREELMSLLRQVILFTSEDSCAARFTFTPGELHLSAVSGQIGEGKANMPVNYGGEKLEIAFNPHYLLDILRHSKDESVQFTLTDSYNPGMITDSTDAEFVIMPMRLD